MTNQPQKGEFFILMPDLAPVPRKPLGALATALTLTALMAACEPAVPKEPPDAAKVDSAVADAPLAQTAAGTADTAPAQGSSYEYRTCMASAGGDADRRQACVQEELAYQDGVLNDWYRELMTMLPEPRRTARRDQQRAWVRETERECDTTTADGQACRLARTLAQSDVLLAALSTERSGGLDSGGQSAHGQPDAQGALTLSAGGATVAMVAAQCGDNKRWLTCTQARLRVDTSEVSGQSLLQPEVVFGLGTGDRGELYQGSLQQGFVDGWSTFAVSDINDDGHEDLMVWSGHGGNYGDPSYTYYLYDPKTRRLVENTALAKLMEGHSLSYIADGRLFVWYRSGGCDRGEKVIGIRGSTPEILARRDYTTCGEDAIDGEEIADDSWMKTSGRTR